MIAALDALFRLALDHPQWLGPAVGLLAFGESLVVLGTIIPATPLLLLIGTMIGRGDAPALVVLPWATAGAIGGYWLSWRLGGALRHRLYRTRIARAHLRDLARARLFLRRWGGASLFLGRYLLGPLQSALPLVAGTLRMNPRRFHTWNIISGVTWPPIVLAPGYLAERQMIAFDISPEVRLWVGGVLAALAVGSVVLALATFALKTRGRGGRPARAQPPA